MSDGTKERWLPPNSLPTRRWLLAAALLVAGYVVALLVFDSDRMPIAEDTDIFRHLGESMPLVIVVLTATFLLGSGPSKAEVTRIAAAFRQRRRTWPSFAGHLLAGELQRGEISDAIVAHAVTNALLAAYVLAFGHWSFW